MSTNLDDDLRRAFDDLATTTSISPDPRFGEFHAEPTESSRRPWLALVAAAACIVLVAGLVVTARDRTRDRGPVDTAPVAARRWFLFPDPASATRYLDPRDAVDAYLADRVTTAPPGETVTYTVNPDGPPFDGTDDHVAIGFSLVVTPDDPALCCDSGDGVARLDLVDGGWFVTSAEIFAMRVHQLGYSDDGIVSGTFSPTIGGTYSVTVDDFGAPGPEEDGIVAVDYAPDPTDPRNGPNFRLPGFTAPAVAVRFWQSPSVGKPFPAAMFAEYIVPRGTDNAANITIDPPVPSTASPSPDTTSMLSDTFPTPIEAAEAYLATVTNGTATLVTAGLLRDVPTATVEVNGRLFTASVDPNAVMNGDDEAWVRFELVGMSGRAEGVARVVDAGSTTGQPAWTVSHAGTRGVVVHLATYQARLVRAELTTARPGEYLVYAHATGEPASSYGGAASLAVDQSGTTFETGVGADSPSTLALALWSTPGTATPVFAEVFLSDRGDAGSLDFGERLDAHFPPDAESASVL